MLFFSEKDNKISIGEEVRQFFLRHPFLKFHFNFSQHQFGLLFPTVPPMSSDHRRYIRFSLSFQARKLQENEQITPIRISQISIGGCLIDWDERVNVGESVRIELQLSNGNWLPLNCKILYRMPESALGVKFMDITKFEQELIAKEIQKSLEAKDLPYESPFATPIEYVQTGNTSQEQLKNYGNLEIKEVLT